MEQLLAALRAAGEPTRLRLLALCAHMDLTVSQLTQILGQSQPRVSRHLKLLLEAGLLDRLREGSWSFYRLAARGPGAELGRTLIDSIPADDPTLALDLERLQTIRRAREKAAADYFQQNAAEWDRVRSLQVDEAEVEQIEAGLAELAQQERQLEQAERGSKIVQNITKDPVDLRSPAALAAA